MRRSSIRRIMNWMRNAPRAAWPMLFLAVLLWSGCEPEDAPSPEPQLRVTPVAFERLPGWAEANLQPALNAFVRSCERILPRPADAPFGPHPVFGRVGDWTSVCNAAIDLHGQSYGNAAVDNAAVRQFFERRFRPHQVAAGRDTTGLFTGYFEPQLRGARSRGGAYTVPLYRRPDDLVSADLGRFDGDLRGERVIGRVERGRLVPYPSRAEIMNGALAERDLELLWVDSRIDKFFLQIQGSGRVLLPDSSLVRVGYNGQNGWPYRAIGRDLIDMGVLTRDNVSLQTIRAWMEAHPAQANALMARNTSYVFFRELRRLQSDEGPLGAQDVPLTPGYSLAVDRDYLPLGAPLWLVTTAPRPEGAQPLRRLMIAQDTGGAIRGAVRGDVFWGAGDRARATAGRMQHPGHYFVLLPATLDAHSAPSSREADV